MLDQTTHSTSLSKYRIQSASAYPRYLLMKNLSVIIYLCTKMLLNAAHTTLNLSLIYSHQHSKSHQRHNTQRKRNIIWFNPPYSKNVKTNVAQRFLRLLDKHFPKTFRLHKIFNRNSVKVSYSCKPNVKSIISNHNRRVLKSNTTSSDRGKPVIVALRMNAHSSVNASLKA